MDIERIEDAPMEEVQPALADLEQVALAAAPSTPTAETREWYRIKAQAGSDPEQAEVDVFGVIGDWFDGVSSSKFIKDLRALPETVKNIRVHVNSPGGSVFDALHMANALRQHPATVEMLIEGLAASAATIVTQGGGDRILIADNALVMVHNPYTMAAGTAKDLRATADALERSQAAIVATYQRKSKLKPRQLAELMDAETWMSAEEAKANGFADKVVESFEAAACVDPAMAAQFKVPEQYVARVQALVVKPLEVPAEAVAAVVEPEPVQAPEALVPAVPELEATQVLELCKTAGLTLRDASEIFEGCATLEAASKAVAARREVKVKEEARQADIRTLCEKFRVQDLAPELIAGGMPLAEARMLVAKVTAREDKVDIDSGLTPAHMGAKAKKPVISYTDTYRRLNNPAK